MSNEILKFLRKKDFRYIKELGRGACGKTILLCDDIINEQFVCKKYAPFNEQDKELLFKNFIQEIKLLHLIYHRNIVRVFNYYIYPEYLTGYILMEYVKGYDIEEYLGKYPENINEVFLQAIEGFSYLETNNILHRDIRPLNLMVTEDGIVKIIDFGFGKRIFDKKDFGKSISLNWWCEPPNEFEQELYDFATEVYFVGKLFEKILREKDIEQFKYSVVLNGMCNPAPNKRLQSFIGIQKSILSERFQEIEFSKNDLKAYRDFSRYLFSAISKIEKGAKYFDDFDKIQSQLKELYKKVMLEEHIPNYTTLTGFFINGAYYYNEIQFPVLVLKSFIDLLRSCSKERRNIIFGNLNSKLDAIKRYDEKDVDDIPF